MLSRAMKNKRSQYIRWGLLLSISLITLCLPGLVAAQQTKQDMDSNKKLIRAGFDQWTAGTGSFFDLLADDVQWTITGSTPYSKVYTSKKQLMDEVLTPLNERLSKKIVPAVTGLYADGDMVIALWDGRATAIDGKPYNATYSWNMQVRKGKIIKVIAFLDGIGFSDIMARIPDQKSQNK